jgi:hypothetical protein
MHFNPNQPPPKDQGPGPRQNQQPQDRIAGAFRVIDQEEQLCQIMADCPRTTVPRPYRVRHGQQQ